MAKIVIAGLGTAGFAAILAARKIDRNADITVIDDKHYDLMHPCGLPYAVEGVIDTFDKLKHCLHLDRMKVTQFSPYRVESIDRDRKTVVAVRNDGCEAKEIPYDKLLICTGTSPFLPPVAGLAETIGKSAFTVSSPEDAERLKLAASRSSRAVCLGAGAIGLETAYALKKMGLDVTVIEMLAGVMPRALDGDISQVLAEYLEADGIRVSCGARLESVVSENGIISSIVVNGDTIPCDLLVVAAGVRANVEIATSADIEVGRTGIVTGERMQTSDEHIFAAGDCAQTRSIIDGRDFTLQLSTTAYRQGTVAGTVMAGGAARYPGISGAFVSRIGELEVAAVGYTADYASSLGYSTIFGKIRDTTLYDWYPGGQTLIVKVVADAATGRVLGGQAVGASGAAARVNVISAAIHAGMTLDALAGLEYAYCPAVSQAYDPVAKAADLAIRKMK